ncbi:MAG TPA: molybdopterin-binding protein [Steroidobacteraceae bacterium]|nr:molybdopterin-binding protein [Steroidobacteraceae bacterium]
MSEPFDRRRRRLLLGLGAGAGSLLVAGCDRISNDPGAQAALSSAEWLTRAVQRALVSRDATARQYDRSDIAPVFRANGTTNPDNPRYQALARGGFRDWRLRIDGLVENPQELSLDALRALPAQTQITRQDCVEGWSCIGQWTGVRLRDVLALALPKPQARYVMLFCADSMDGGSNYYESIDLRTAAHPQTLLAYALNGETLPIAYGAPLRLRLGRQLGYKMAKYVMHVQLVASYRPFGQGQGGYWEDQGYAWYAGI